MLDFHKNISMTQHSTHTHTLVKLQLNVTDETLDHVWDTCDYEGEGRHEEQSGSGRQAGRHHQQSTDDDDNGMSAALTLLVAANTGRTADPGSLKLTDFLS